jgi:hypothetical protein
MHRARKIQWRPVGKPVCKSLYSQVVVAIVLGVLIENFYSESEDADKVLDAGKTS